MSCIQGLHDSFSELADSDGNEQSLESFSVQLLELLLTMTGQPRYNKVLQNHLGDLAYFTIRYMQMTSEQEETWSSDPNEFVADEDEVLCSCRVSGIMLLEELVATYEVSAVQSIVQAVERRCSEAAESKAHGRADWWKIREAAILAIGTISESVIEMNTGSFLPVDTFLDSLLQDLSSVCS